jgi:hypothetical protein
MNKGIVISVPVSYRCFVKFGDRSSRVVILSCYILFPIPSSKILDCEFEIGHHEQVPKIQVIYSHSFSFSVSLQKLPE